MSTETHDMGDRRTFDIQFTDVAGLAGDPSSVTFRLGQPDGTVISYVYGAGAEVQRLGVGQYQVQITFDQSGRYHARYEGSSGLTVAEGIEIYIKRNEF